MEVTIPILGMIKVSLKLSMDIFYQDDKYLPVGKDY